MAQKPQKIAYIDMEYILENVPEYTDAQARLNAKVISWQQRLNDLKREIEVMKTDLSNEKALLTKELVAEREEDIKIKELDLKNLQAGYFGPTGDLYSLRQQLVKPVQDQIYNAVQEIAVRKKYDIVLDKSSDLIMLYTNKKYDVSEQVLNRIVKGRKVKALVDKKNEKSISQLKTDEDVQERVNEKEARNVALRTRIKEQQDARAKKRAEIKKAAEEKRKKRLEEIEKRKKARETTIKSAVKTSDTLTTKVADSIATPVKVISEKELKRQALLERARLAKEAKNKKRQDLIKEKEEKRKKRLEELEKRKNKKEENNNEN